MSTKSDQESAPEGFRPETAVYPPAEEGGAPEGSVAKAIEQRTKNIPSDVFLWSAVGAIGASLCLQLMGRQKTSNFIGLWVPTLLVFGLYNKIVKVMGSESTECARS